MDGQTCITALTRAVSYLRLATPRRGADPCRRALSAVQGAVEGGRGRVIGRTMDELTRHVRPTTPAARPAAPPIERGHIGYPTAQGRSGRRGQCAGPYTRKRHAWRWAALRRRSLMTLLVVSQTLVASWFMLGVLPYQRVNVLSISLIAVFAVLFAWVSVGFWMAAFGFAWRCLGGDPWSLLRRHPAAALGRTPLVRTAVVMPICHEPVDRCMRGLRAVHRSLAATGKLDHFEFFILSDSRDPDIWLAEQAAWHELCEELGDHERVHYRRRVVNLRYKSGNIADFLRRWGRRFRYMLVLDADSLMEGQTIVRMVQLMEREPRVGILQSAPRICGARSPFALIQQFANRVYGSLFTTGLASVQLGDAVYWGHNAIIRVDPFMRHCGLRRLRGPGVFGGAIMSHDFVEAAYMGRAGYEVWLEPGLGGSYEESPPTLLDELARDRRWSRGNLQHLWLVLSGRHISLPHRLALVTGVFSYAASPLWFLFLVLTTIKVARFALWPIDYFPQGHTLFPLWPVWHPGWALQLAGTTAFLLFMPKVLALVDAAVRPRLRRAYGGLWRLLAGIVMESLASAVFAPIRMVWQTRFVSEALCNLDVRWAGQNRGEEISWRLAVRTSAVITVLAAAWAGFAWYLQPAFFYWSLPVAVPLVLSAPLTVWLSRLGVGVALRRRGHFHMPEDENRPRLMQELERPRARSFEPLPLPAFEAAVLDPARNRLHRQLARPVRGPRAGEATVLMERCLYSGREVLSGPERTLLARDPDALSWLHHYAWRSPAGSPWSEHIDRIARRTVREDAAPLPTYAAFGAAHASDKPQGRR
ncbi:MAG TPA: glucans biosynthesis glucosyltransferase MdoH [Gammaproteobacteria bacterium]|nr:glucans biosynthesis glucosyltransferase MdoH [Gammaproteobacteria bacterium]